MRHSGTLTLDANGTATVTVDTLFSSTNPLTDGTGTLTFQLTTLPVADTVTVVTPTLEYFTTANNDALVGNPNGDTTFVGVVDNKTVGNNTLSNGETAVGFGTGNTLQITVNAASTDIIPGGNGGVSDTGIQTLQVTDVNSDVHFINPYVGFAAQTYFNLQFMPDLTAINLVANDNWQDQFFNVQNLVNVGIIGSDFIGAYNVEVYVINSVAAALLAGPIAADTVTLNLDNAGSMNLLYQDTSGNDFVQAFDITNAGDNGLKLDGASAASEIIVSGTGSLWMSFDGWISGVKFYDQDLYNLTLVDASGLGGAYTDNYQFGFDPDIWQNFTLYGAQGNNFIDLHDDVTGNTITVYTGAGNDHIHVNTSFGNGETVTVYSGDGNTGSTTTGSGNGGNSIDLHGWKAVNQTLNAYIGNGNNNVNIVSADKANVTVAADTLTVTSPSGNVYIPSGTDNGNNNIDIDLWVGQISSLSSLDSSAQVTVGVGDGSNDIHINTDKFDSGAWDVGSHVTVTATDVAGGPPGFTGNDVHIGEGYDATTVVTLGNGDGDAVHVDNLGGGVNSVRATTTITVGSGSSDVVGFHDHGNGYQDVYIYLGNYGLLGGGDTTAGGNVWAEIQGNSTLTESLGSGIYTVNDYVNGDSSTVTFNSLDQAGGGNTINVDLDGNYNSAYITVGDGNNHITVVDLPSLTGDYVDITTGGGSNVITVDLSGVTDSTVIIAAGTAGGSGATHGNNEIQVTLDTAAPASSLTLTAGDGNNTIGVFGVDGNTVSITTGAGNDWIAVDSTALGSGLTVDGGGGYNTLAIGDTTALETATLAAASISNVQALELTSMMTHNIDVLDLGAGGSNLVNDINQVILDDGYLGFGIFDTITLSGLTNNAEIDLLWGQSGGSTLLVPIGNASPNPVDVVNILADSQAYSASSGVTHHYGDVNVDPLLSGSVHTVNVVSTDYSPSYAYSDVNNLAITDSGIVTLNILGAGTGTAYSMVQDQAFHGDGSIAGSGAVYESGDVYLNLNGSDNLGGSLTPTTVNANTFYAGIEDTDGALGSTGHSITFNAINTTDDILVFGNGTGDAVYLANYDNAVTMGNGNNDVLTMTNNYSSEFSHNDITRGTNSGHNTVVVGNGNNDVISLDNNDGGTAFYGDSVTVGHGNNDQITLGTGGSIHDSSVTINGNNTSGTAGTPVDTVTFDTTSGGGNTVTPTYASGTVINLGGHGTADTIVFSHVTDSSFNYNDTINGFVAAAGPGSNAASPDTINLAAVIGADTVNGHAAANGLATNVLQANNVLAVLADAVGNTAGNDVVVYDYANGTLYDFHNGATNLTFSSANTMQIQIGVLGVNHFTTADLIVH